MSARRFRHRDRQQVRPGSPQQAPGGAPPGIRIRSIRHYAPPHTAARRFGLPAAYASGISDTAHHGHRVPDIRRTPDTGVRHTGLPAAYTSEIKYPVFPTSGAAGRLASGMKKSDMKKGNPVSDSLRTPLLRPHPGRRGYFFSGRAIDSRIDVSAMMFFIL